MLRLISFGGSGNLFCLSGCMNHPKNNTQSNCSASSMVSTKTLFSTMFPPPNWMKMLLAPERAMMLPYTVTPQIEPSR